MINPTNYACLYVSMHPIFKNWTILQIYLSESVQNPCMCFFKLVPIDYDKNDLRDINLYLSNIIGEPTEVEVELVADTLRFLPPVELLRIRRELFLCLSLSWCDETSLFLEETCLFPLACGTVPFFALRSLFMALVSSFLFSWPSFLEILFLADFELFLPELISGMSKIVFLKWTTYKQKMVSSFLKSFV